jgi:outer membrane protein assembly factor BamB
MKFLFILIILIFIQGCSFDNKTGIWKNESNTSKNKKNQYSEFETLITTKEVYKDIKPIKNGFKFKLGNKIENTQWKDVFYNGSNNSKNFKYKDLNQQIFKSKKTTRNKINDRILFIQDNMIITDDKGNIIIFAINNNKIYKKFNFYKKTYKNIKKKLNLVVDNNIIYVSDNIGFLYAYDFENNKIIWAKNYKIPFRSNLKIYGNKLIAANQNNSLFSFNIQNGEILKTIPTEETTVKNYFINNLAINKDSLFFLNTYGSLYAIDKLTMKVKWFINLNQSSDLNLSNLFIGNQIVNDKNKIVISSNDYLYVLEASNGSLLHKKNFSTLLKPIINNNYLFLISKNNLLISINLNTGNIIYSYDINKKIAEFLNTKEKSVEFKDLMIVNNKLFVFLKNSYVLKFNINGVLEKIDKLPSKLNSHPIIVENSILFLDYKNKISIVD